MPSDVQLLTEFNTLVSSGISKTQARKRIASDYGLSFDSVRGRIGRAARNGSNVIDVTSVLEENARLRAEIAHLNAGMYYASAHEDTDERKWQGELDRLAQMNRMVKVAMLNDVHLPDEDHQALELAYRILEDFAPDLVGTGSDVFDMDVLSLKFSRPYNRKRVDPIDEVCERYAALVDRVQSAAPNATLFAIADNHGTGRFEAYADTVTPIFGDRLIRDYNTLIRAGGRVLWLGWKQETYIHETMFEHGLKHGRNAAKQNAERRGMSLSGMAGHAHTPGSYVHVVNYPVRGEIHRRMYVSMVTPCLCNVPSHYQRNTRVTRDAVQGLGIAHVNMKDYDTHMQNILFYRRSDRSLAAVFGGKEYSVKASAKVYEFAG